MFAYAGRVWYNVRRTDIIPAHTGFCIYRANPDAQIYCGRLAHQTRASCVEINERRKKNRS